MKARKYYSAIGLMSGTSADGISVSYCRIDLWRKKIQLLAFKNYRYTKTLQEKIIGIRNSSLAEISWLNYELGKVWCGYLIKFLKEFKISSTEIDVIGSHGQTIYHNSDRRNTFQIGEPAFIAEALKVPVVSDFRHQDIASGGEGAPLVPFFDEFLFGNGKPVALQNIGGIGNISIVGKDVKTYGFDTGPGNSLMDWAVFLITKGKERFDKNGNWAKIGKVDEDKVRELMKNKFFLKSPPKSLDREEFGKKFLMENFKITYTNRFNLLATLNYFTAYSIAFSVKKYVKEKISEIIISGGGALNPVLIDNIKRLLPEIKITSIEKYGINSLAKESMAFALMAVANLASIPNNCPFATGSKGRRILGKIIYPFGLGNL